MRTAGNRSGAGFPRWASPANLVLCILGLGISAYLTYEHFSASSTLSCPATGGVINCLKVTTSSFSVINGVPVAVLGLVFFVVMIVLQSPPAWRTANRLVVWGRLIWCLVGVGTAIYLLQAELFHIHAICLWCTFVHVLSLLVFIVTAFATASRREDVSDDDEEDVEHRDGRVAVH